MRYMINDAFHVLQIKPTDDKREIKKAYAKLVKEYHPEEHPTEWKNIRDAYETAIAYAERQSDARVSVSYKEEAERMRPETVSFENAWSLELAEDFKYSADLHMPEPDEVGEVFNNLEELSKQQAKQIQGEKLAPALQKLKRLKRIKDTKRWENFFYELDIEVMATGVFLHEWGKLLKKQKVSKELYQILNNQLIRITEYCNQRGITPEKIGKKDSLEYVRQKLNNTQKKKYTFLRLCLAIILIGAIVDSDIFQDFLEYLDRNPIEKELLEQYPMNKDDVDAFKGTRYKMEKVLDDISIAQHELEWTVRGRYADLDYGISDILQSGILVQEGVYFSDWDTRLPKEELEQEFDYKILTDVSELGNIREINPEGKDFFAFKAWEYPEDKDLFSTPWEYFGEDETKIVLGVGLQPEKLGIDKKFRIFFSYGGGYVEVREYNEENTYIGSSFCYALIEDYYMFSVLVPEGEEKDGITVVVIEE